jgi:hypothetical protein
VLLRAVGLALLAVTLPLVGLGVWNLVAEDLQGGRREVAVLFLAAGAVAALAGAAALRLARVSTTVGSRASR